MRIRFAPLLLLVLFVAPRPVRGDAMPIVPGRYSGGKATLLTLTAQQALTARTKRVVVLTPSQQRRLLREAHVAPTVLDVSLPAVAALDCTDFTFNVGLLIAPTEIEVPHRYLVSDDEAARRTKDFEDSILLDAAEAPESHPQ